jgi:hypothetical protein
VNSSPSVEVYVPVAVPVAVVVPNRHHQPGHVEKPVYWGFGGQLRPDAWGQPPQRQREPDRRGSDNDRKSNDRDPSPTVRRR